MQIASVSVEHDKRTGGDTKSTKPKDAVHKSGNKAGVSSKQLEKEESYLL